MTEGEGKLLKDRFRLLYQYWIASGHDKEKLSTKLGSAHFDQLIASKGKFKIEVNGNVMIIQSDTHIIEFTKGDSLMEDKVRFIKGE